MQLFLEILLFGVLGIVLILKCGTAFSELTCKQSVYERRFSLI